MRKKFSWQLQPLNLHSVCCTSVSARNVGRRVRKEEKSATKSSCTFNVYVYVNTFSLVCAIVFISGLVCTC
jgi:hypothetical protein